MLGIDLGSNTLRYCVLDENLKKLQEGEFIIGAAKGLEKTGLIGTEALSRLKNALLAMKNAGLSLENARAGATAAFRKAHNTEAIFSELKNEFGVHFSLISSSDEARLSILGMDAGLKSLNLQSLEKGYCDLGGASCELSFKGLFKSFDFGIISFYEKAKGFELRGFKSFDFSKMLKKFPKFAFKLKDKKLKLSLLIKDKNLLQIAFVAFDEVALARRFVATFRNSCKKTSQNSFKNSLSKASKNSFKNSFKNAKPCPRFFVLNSGVPTALVALKKGLNLQTYTSLKINGARLKTSDFLHFALKLAKMSELEAAPQIGKARKNHLIAGCFLFYALFDKERFIVIDEGLREGLCIEALSILNAAQKGVQKKQK